MNYPKILLKFITLLALIGLCIGPVLADKRGPAGVVANVGAASQRIALVIGNGGYPNNRRNNLFGPLDNPLNDADDMKAMLERYGFKVLLLKDGNRQAMEDAIDDFTEQLQYDSVGLFYFAGHGVQVEGVNYLIPVGQRFRRAKNVKFHAINATEVLEMMEEAGTQVNLMILDACREHLPVKKSRGLSRLGLAEMTATGTIVAYASAPGKTASDGGGRNGVYTQHLLNAMNNGGGLPIYEVFQNTGAAVKKATNNAQNPWINSSFYGQFCFGPCRGRQNVVIPPARPDVSQLLRTCERHFKANRLTTGRGGTALVCYEEVLQQDKHNAEALEGLENIEAKYVGWIESFIKRGRFNKAKQYLANLRKVNPESPKLVELEERMQPSSVVSPSQLSSLPSTNNNAFRAGKVFRDRLKDGSLGPEMVWVPAGDFRMGDIQGGGRSDEQPVHWVSVKRLAMGTHEVTVGDFRRFVRAKMYKTDAEKGGDCWTHEDGWKKVKGANWRNPKFSQNDNHPVVCVSWNDATTYADWLSQQTSRRYRLPTEAEWEYTARAGSETMYWWGTEIGSNKANCYGNMCGDRFEYTAPVGSFVANAFGLYDTAGNVWEWTCSEYENKSNSKKNRRISQNSPRALRGGAWGYLPRSVRTASRKRVSQVNRSGYVGFRLARQP
jgi:formylglycine-generating enzyme required for sulfatase activity